MRREQGEAVAVFRDEAGSLYAVDNRCPHEGYPLVQGEVTDCVLTCAWHNYKFDLRDGQCLLGEEDVRSFPVREENGDVLLDLTPPDPATERARLFKSLHAGALEGDLGRVARDLARLLAVGVAPESLLAEAAALDGSYARYGSTHVPAVATDLVPLVQVRSGEDRLRVVLQAFELFVEGNQRRELRELPPRSALSGASQDEFLQAVELENADDARSIARSMLGANRFAELHDWLLVAASAHFLDFGHKLIYVMKLRELAPHCTPAQLERVVDGLVYSIVTGTREDLLPPMAELREHLENVSFTAAGEATLGAAAHDQLVQMLLDGKAAELHSALDAHLEAGVSADSLCSALVHAAAERFWRFDADIHENPAVQDNWLTVTHPLTHAHATRLALQQRCDARTLRSLYFAAHFIHRARKLDRDVAAAPHTAKSPSLRGLREAMRAGQLEAALAQASGLSFDEELRALFEELSVGDAAVRAIYLAHVLKTARVVLDEAAFLPERAARVGLLGLVRFAVVPKRERAVAQLALEAFQLVNSGKLPKLLSS